MVSEAGGLRLAEQQAASSKQQAQAGPATVYRCAGSRAALALARLTAWTLGRGRLLNAPRVGRATLDSAREEPGRLAAAASRRASSGRAASLSGLRCAALLCNLGVRTRRPVPRARSFPLTHSYTSFSFSGMDRPERVGVHHHPSMMFLSACLCCLHTSFNVIHGTKRFDA